jgi:hypothetical protein
MGDNNAILHLCSFILLWASMVHLFHSLKNAELELQNGPGWGTSLLSQSMAVHACWPFKTDT